MESSCTALETILTQSPDCIAVEAPLALQSELLHAASRLPDISVIEHGDLNPSYYIVEPCDPISEAIRTSLELGIPIFCIDSACSSYPEVFDPIPDPYAIKVLGAHTFFKECLKHPYKKVPEDSPREHHIARQLKELNKHYESILYLGGIAHEENILSLLKSDKALKETPLKDVKREIFTLSEESQRANMGELGYISSFYEKYRLKYMEEAYQNPLISFGDFEWFPPDRKIMYLDLLKKAAKNYEKATGFTFQRYHLKNLLQFYRKYTTLTGHLLPDAFQLFTGAKACVDHNYAYEVWLLATTYSHLRNIDNLPVRDLSPEEIWGNKKSMRFHLKKLTRNAHNFSKRQRDQKGSIKTPLNPYSICSFQPEDSIIEGFALHMKKRGSLILQEEQMRVQPFSCSLEDGIDFRETIRNIADKKIYVKSSGKPPKPSGAVILIFDDDTNPKDQEKYPWCTTWLGEHNQESDMAFYATPMNENIIGPGIARCSYGGLMMTYPPGRLHPVWEDTHYQDAQNKPELLLFAAIDYSVEPIITYIAKSPPRAYTKSLARSFGKKILYIPIGQLSPITLKKIQKFHVLGGHQVRNIADDYIY